MLLDLSRKQQSIIDFQTQNDKNIKSATHAIDLLQAELRDAVFDFQKERPAITQALSDCHFYSQKCQKQVSNMLDDGEFKK